MKQIKRQQRKENTNTLFKKDWLRTLEDTEDNPLTKDRIMNWMASTGFIEGFIRIKSHALDKPFLDDYIQEVWVQILQVPEEKILFLYRAGKGRFTNYIKSLIMNNIHSTCSILYKNIRQSRTREVYLDESQWEYFTENDNTDIQVPTTILGKEDGNIISEFEIENITAELNLYEYDSIEET
jgi:hypothetical protein